MHSLNRLFFRGFVAGCALVAVACGGAEVEDEPEQDAEDDSFLESGKADATGAREGSAEAFAILRTATALPEKTLAEGVKLGKATAASIAKYRLGRDGRAGTADDERFERLKELDAVKNVGTLAFGRLLAYAKAQGLVTKAQAVCGARRSSGDLSRLPAELRAAVPDLRLRTGTDRLEIYVNEGGALADRDVELIRLRVCQALEFDLGVLGIDAGLSALAKPYRVVILDRATYDVATKAPGTDGLAYMKERGSDDAFVVPANAPADAIEFDDTLAHELEHVIVGRLAPNDGELPWYVLEGTAVNLGASYTRAVHGKITGWVRDHARRATGESARTIWERYGLEDRTRNIEEVEHDQAISGLFLEHLRTKTARDVQARMLQLMRDVSGGDEFGAAFATRIGLPLARAKSDFEAALRATTGDERARFRGTIYE